MCSTDQSHEFCVFPVNMFPAVLSCKFSFRRENESHLLDQETIALLPENKIGDEADLRPSIQSVCEGAKTFNHKDRST